MNGLNIIFFALLFTVLIDDVYFLKFCWWNTTRKSQTRFLYHDSLHNKRPAKLTLLCFESLKFLDMGYFLPLQNRLFPLKMTSYKYLQLF